VPAFQVAVYSSALGCSPRSEYLAYMPVRFGCIQDSRAFCQQFFHWYNQEHRHSGIGLLTPAMVHFGEAPAVLARRQAVLDAAYQAHADRFVRRPPKPLPLPSAVWINKPVPPGQNLWIELVVGIAHFFLF
jgi:putative transposase